MEWPKIKDGQPQNIDIYCGKCGHCAVSHTSKLPQDLTWPQIKMRVFRCTKCGHKTRNPSVRFRPEHTPGGGYPKW